MFEQLNDDLKSALKAGNSVKVAVLRLVLAACKEKRIAKKSDLNDEDILAVLSKQAKQRRESITAYQQVNRPDLAACEEAELAIIQSYLPSQLSPSELDSLVDEAIQSVSAGSIKQMGEVMAYLSPKIKGRADGGAVSQLVKQKLT